MMICYIKVLFLMDGIAFAFAIQARFESFELITRWFENMFSDWYVHVWYLGDLLYHIGMFYGEWIRLVSKVFDVCLLLLVSRLVGVAYYLWFRCYWVYADCLWFRGYWMYAYCLLLESTWSGKLNYGSEIVMISELFINVVYHG